MWESERSALRLGQKKKKKKSNFFGHTVCVLDAEALNEWRDP